jgi:hypothetical protein
MHHSGDIVSGKYRFILFGSFTGPVYGLLWGVLFSSLLISGCSSPQEEGAGAYREDFSEVFGGPRGGSEAAGEAAWAIVLGVQSGRGAMERAEAAAAAMRERFGLASARAAPRPNGAVVLFGGYDAPDDREAQRDLDRVQGLEVEGGRPFRTAFLAPQGGPAEGSYPQFNLNNAKSEYGEGAKYTLQIAVYETPGRRDAMEAAEQATLELRREGELAFYYHGPTKSMVTVGLFGDRDYDPQTGRRSGELRELQERYPHNLLNGRTIIERRVEGERTQPSTLVAVPGGR